MAFHLLINIFLFIVAFTGMEGVAWLTHKYLMHGWLWGLHRDHHHKDHPGFLEHNDLFFLIFAIPGITCLIAGIFFDIQAYIWMGSGISFYGACYFFVHDIYIHQRLKVLRNSENRYLKALRRAHKMHHKHVRKENGECFGMLWVPLRYFTETKKTSAQ